MAPEGVLKNAIVMYVLSLALLVVLRPSPVYDAATGRPRPFGTNPGETLFTLQTCATVLAVACYYLALYGGAA